jgi:Reticulon
VLLADVAANFLRSMVSARWRDSSAWGRSEVGSRH